MQVSAKLGNFERYMEHFALDTFRFAYRLAPLKIVMNNSFQRKLDFATRLSGEYDIIEVDCLDFLGSLFNDPKFLFLFEHKLGAPEKRTLQMICRNLSVNRPAFFAAFARLLQNELVYFEAYQQHLFQKYLTRKLGEMDQDFEVRPKEEPVVTQVSPTEEENEMTGSDPDNEESQSEELGRTETSGDNPKSQDQDELFSDETDANLKNSDDPENSEDVDNQVGSESKNTKNRISKITFISDETQNQTETTLETLPSYTPKHSDFLLEGDEAVGQGMASMYVRLLKYRLQMSDCRNQGYILLNLEKLFTDIDLAHFFYRHPLLSVYADSLFNPFSHLLYSLDANSVKQNFFKADIDTRTGKLLTPLNFDLVVRAADYFSAQTSCNTIKSMKISEFTSFLKFLFVPSSVLRKVQVLQKVDPSRVSVKPSESQSSEKFGSDNVEEFVTGSVLVSPEMSVKSPKSSHEIEYLKAKVGQVGSIFSGFRFFSEISGGHRAKNLNNQDGRMSFLKGNGFDMDGFLDFDFEKAERQRVLDIIMLESKLFLNLDSAVLVKEWGRFLEETKADTSGSYYEKMMKLVLYGREEEKGEQDAETEGQEDSQEGIDTQNMKVGLYSIHLIFIFLFIFSGPFINSTCLFL